jgi:hypothetical protein
MEFERRYVARTTIAKDARLFFDAQRGVLTCRVQNVTNSGAGIELDTLNALPLNFELSFDNFHTVRECRVIWRQGDFVGVAFQNWRIGRAQATRAQAISWSTSDTAAALRNPRFPEASLPQPRKCGKTAAQGIRRRDRC